MTLTRSIEQILEIIEQRGRRVNFSRRRLDVEQNFRTKHGSQLPEHFAAVHSQQHCPLAGSVRDTELDPHQETVELRFGKRERSDLVLRILCCDDKKWPRQF